MFCNKKLLIDNKILICEDDYTKFICENGNILQYIKEQIPEICLEAVKKNGKALQYIHP